MSEHICTKCKWHHGDRGYGECSWTRNNPHPDAFLCGTNRNLAITRAVYDCQTFDMIDVSCLNCKHFSKISNYDVGECKWKKSNPSAPAWVGYRWRIKMIDPFINCKAWETK